MKPMSPTRTVRWRLTLFAYAALLIYRLVAVPGYAWLTLEADMQLAHFDRMRLLPRPISISDLVVNVAGFGLLGALLVRGLEERSSRRRGLRAALWQAGLVGLLVSLAVELLQQHIPGRVASLLDVGTDTIGAALGGLAAWRFAPEVDAWIEARIDRGLGWRVVWFVVALAVVQLWPFDLRTATNELVQGLREAQWNPLEPLPGGLAGGLRRLVDLMLYLPLGYLVRRQMPAMPWSALMLVGLAVGGGLEASQLMVQGRVASVQPALLAVAGTLIGGWIATPRRTAR